MSEETLSEMSGRARKEPPDDIVPLTPTPDSTLTVAHPSVYLCRWDRAVKEGDKLNRVAVEASGYYEAAVAFAKLCDHENPRPPARRVAVVKLPGKEEVKIMVRVRPALSYETFDE